MHVVTVDARTLFQALADPCRIRILRLLAVTRDECCLCELVDSLLEPEYKVSRHLKFLKQAGVLTMEREGRFVYHRLVVAPRFMSALHALLRALPDQDTIFSADLARFRERQRL